MEVGGPTNQSSCGKRDFAAPKALTLHVFRGWRNAAWRAVQHPYTMRVPHGVSKELAKKPPSSGFSDRDYGGMLEFSLNRDRVVALPKFVRAADALDTVPLADVRLDDRRSREESSAQLTEHV
jgi:hypothetical protein